MEYVYEKLPYEKPKSSKKFYLVPVIIIMMVLFIMFYWQNMPSDLTEEECIVKLTEWCNECFLANKYSVNSTVSENTIGKDVLECSNLYFASNWTEGQNCGSDLTFCDSFLVR